VPLIRTGSRRSAFEQTPEAAVASLAEGINTFRRNGARGIREIKVVAYPGNRNISAGMLEPIRSATTK